MSGPGCLPGRIPGLVRAHPVRPGDGRCDPARGDPGAPCPEPWDVRRAAGPCRAASHWAIGRPQAGRPADAHGRPRRRPPSTTDQPDPVEGADPDGTRPGPARLLGTGTRSPVGHRHHLPADGSRVPLSGRHRRRLESPCRRLGDGRPPPDGSRHRGARRGDRRPRPGCRAHPSLRPQAPSTRASRSVPGCARPASRPRWALRGPRTTTP